MRWPFSKRSDADPAADRARTVPDRTPGPRSDREVVEALAAEHLPDGVREQWLALLRPAVRLVHAEGPVVARFGGLPVLPDAVPWPVWEGRGPLAYVGEVHCAALAGFGLDLAVPRTGRLLFFYFDGRLDDGVETVGYWDPATGAGARALYLTDDVPGAIRQPPVDELVSPEAALAGLAVVTAPTWEHPDLRARFMRPGEDHGSFMEHPVCADAFQEALYERHTGPNHQVGGYADPVQGPIEAEVAQFALGNIPWEDPRLEVETARWELLLQVDSDDRLGLMWGDAGTLYWAARPDDLAAGDLGQVGFTWQCG